jgi:hypothetical protein
MGFAACLVVVLPSSAFAVQRYVAPDAPATGDCTDTAPCELEYAIETKAAPHDEVIVAPGTYQKSTSITVAKTLDVHGTYGQPRPRIVSSATYGLELLTFELVGAVADGTTVTHLEIENTSSDPNSWGLLLQDVSGVTLSRLVVIARSFAVGLQIYSPMTVRDTVAWSRGLEGFSGIPALGVYQGSAAVGAEAFVRNVTAVSSGASGTGLHVGRNVSVDAKNVVARGTGSDLAVQGLSGEPASLTIGHSNYRPGEVSQNPPHGTVNDGGNNQSAEPLFVNGPSGDFHQVAGSPTVDAGTTDVRTGAADFDGDTRPFGAAMDIGGDEFLPPSAGGNGDGSGHGPGGALLPDTIDPAARDLAVRPRRFSPLRRGAAVVTAAGTRVSYTLSEVALMTFRIERAAPGRRVGRRCVRPTRSNVRRRRCTRYVRVKGRFEHAGVTGPNGFRFSGRLHNRPLKRARYRLVGVPVDPAQNRGKSVRAGFKIVRR